MNDFNEVDLINQNRAFLLSTTQNSSIFQANQECATLTILEIGENGDIENSYITGQDP